MTINVPTTAPIPAKPRATVVPRDLFMSVVFPEGGGLGAPPEMQ
jgi:hypothetical protein